ncbi:MAG: DUF2303 family protein [Reyranella sp.]
MTTLPAETDDQPESDRPPYLVLEPFIKDAVTGETFVHKDYVQTQKPWAEAEHRDYIGESLEFGDLTSWADYVDRFAEPSSSIVTWNSIGLRADLAYLASRAQRAGRLDDDALRGQLVNWHARYPFKPTPEWAAWAATANGQAISHTKIVEFLDDHLDDVQEPAPLVLMNVLRKLRASTKYEAETELRENGTASVSFRKDDRVVGDAEVELPGEIEIVIPIMRGHVDAAGEPINYKLVVKVRATVQDGALFLRLSVPAKDKVIEQVYADLVGTARELLGSDGPPIYRTAG